MGEQAQKLGEMVAWDGSKLVATGDEVVSKLRRKALSASTSKSMQSCVARWAGERLMGKTMGPFEPAPLGTAAHAVMEDLMGLEPSARTIERAEELTRARGAALWPDDPNASKAVREAVAANRLRWIDEVFVCWLGLFTIENPQDVNVYAREMVIEGIILNGVPTIGYIDRVEFGNKDGVPGLISVDYKSGKVPNKRYGDDHGDQLRVYTAAVEHKTGQKPVAARVYYTKHGKSVDVDISPKAIDKTLAVFRSSWNKHNKYMKEGAFPTKTSTLCGWCPLVNACPAAKADGKGPRIDGLPTAVSLGIPTVGVPAPQPVPEAVPADAGHPEISSLETAAAVSAEVFAAHIPVSTYRLPFHEEEDLMPKITEDKSWIKTTVEGEMNPNSFASMAVFGLASLAVEELDRAGIQLNRTNVSALAHTFKHVTTTAQSNWTGSTDLMDGANTRMRGALRTVLQTLPLPFGQDAEAWDAWVRQTVKRVGSIATVALELWDTDASELKPWESLANVTGTPKAIAAPVVAAVPALAAVPEPAEPAEKPKAAPKRAPRASRSSAAAAAAPVSEPAPAPALALAPEPVAEPEPAPAPAPEAVVDVYDVFDEA